MNNCANCQKKILLKFIMSFYNIKATDIAMYEEIIKANPNVPIEPTLPAGIKLRIPVFDDSETIKFDLPPWKK